MKLMWHVSQIEGMWSNRELRYCILVHLNVFLLQFSLNDWNGLFTDNHDVVSLKLYQLTVLRSETEEKEEEDEITLPSVDNMDLLKSKAHYLSQTYTSLALLYSNNSYSW